MNSLLRCLEKRFRNVMKIEELNESIEWVTQQKEKMAALMRELPNMGALSGPMPMYEDALNSLKHHVSNIAFCGKVNSGKSTLLNAVMGRSVLPTADRPLSSRIVEIENCAEGEENVTLVLFDGSERTFAGIAALEKFAVEQGSEVSEVEGVELDNIMLIRLRCHMAGFPEGIRLVDTPGIAASYETHGLLTFRYLKKAHAVVYVLKSDTPVMKADEPFLKEVVGANKNIIFVQSCAEIYDDERVSKTRTRNLELLSEIMGIAQEKIEYFVLAARCELEPPTGLQERRRYKKCAPAFKQFMSSWSWMLCRTAGLDALEYAALCVKSYAGTNIEQMRERAEIAKDNKEGEQICLQAARRAREFREAWVQDGPEWKKLVENLEKAVLDAKKDILDRMIALEERMAGIMGTLSDNKEVKAFTKALTENINAEWQWVQEACIERLNKCMLSLTWNVPSMSKQTCGRLLGNGSLVPLKMKEFGFFDFVRLGSFLLSLATGNVLGVIWKGINILSSLGKREEENAKALQSAIEELHEKFRQIRENLEQQMESEKNPLAVFFKMSMSQSYQAVTLQHNCLLEQAAEQFQACVCTEEQNQRTLALLGTQETPGLISCWETLLGKIEDIQKKISERRESVINCA